MRCLEAFLGSLLGPALLQCYVLEGWWESKVLPCHCSAALLVVFSQTALFCLAVSEAVQETGEEGEASSSSPE